MTRMPFRRYLLRWAAVFVLLMVLPKLVRAEAVPPPPDIDVPMISVAMAKPYYDQGRLVFIDVRGDTPYEAEHITGALNLSLVAIRGGTMPPVPKNTVLVTYCGCPHAMADEAGRYLKAAGFQEVYVLDEGYYGWKEAGHPVTVKEARARGLERMTVAGTAPGLPTGTAVYARHVASDQWEKGALAADGRFELHLPFYNVPAGAEIAVQAGPRRATVPFAGDRQDVVLR